MKKRKIAMLFPYAPLYREPIYMKMDNEFNVDWYFCNNSSQGLKLMDYSKLKNVNLSMVEHRYKTYFLFYTGLSKLPLSEYDYIIMVGQPRCFSEWFLTMKYGQKKKGPKVYFWTHGWYGKESKLQKMLKRIYYHYADGIFVYGDRAKQLMISEGYDENKIFPIHNSLNYDVQMEIRRNLVPSNIYKEHFRNNYPVLLFIGRLTKVKQLDLLVMAVAKLAEQREYYNLIFVGNGSEELALKELVNSCGIDKQVWFYGACYDEKTNAELIYNADLCVAPGNIGLTAMHSLGYGTPCLTHNNFDWQMPECEAIKEDATGSFFNYKDVESLVQSIKSWFEKKSDKREQVRQACYKEIDEKWNPYYQIDILKKQLK